MNSDGERDRRLAPRFSTTLVGQLVMPAASGLLRRSKPRPFEIEVADLSVTGAAVRVPERRGLKVLQRGLQLSFSIDDRRGQVAVRRMGRTEGYILLGLDFIELSPELEQYVYEHVRAMGDTRGSLEAFWASAR